MNHVLKTTLAVFVATMLWLPVCSAERVAIPLGEQGSLPEQSIPRLGMSKSYVARVFGEPQQVKGPVGNPPIYTWHYPDFTVYFEYDTVIHSVQRAAGAKK